MDNGGCSCILWIAVLLFLSVMGVLWATGAI
jgi:hypothetical protein